MTNNSATENSLLELEFPAHSGQIAILRRQLTAWLAGIDFGENDSYNLVLAVNEAVSNAVEHAYRDPEGATVRVTAEAGLDGTVSVMVVDHGHWRVPPTALSARGRGLLLMRESVDQVMIDRGDSGTTITLRLAPGKPAPLAPQVPHGPRGHEVVVHENSDCVQVTVRGEVPAHAGPTLRRTLSTLARGGSVPIRVDLSELGTETDGLVHALFTVAEAAEAAGNRVVVLAPQDSPGHTAVTAAGLRRVIDVTES